MRLSDELSYCIRPPLVRGRFEVIFRCGFDSNFSVWRLLPPFYDSSLGNEALKII